MKFEQMKYERLNLEEEKSKLQAIIEQFDGAKTYEEAKSAFLLAQSEFAYINTIETLATTRNSLNSSDDFYDGEVKFWNFAGPQLKEFDAVFKGKMLRSKFKEEFMREYPKVYFVNAKIEEEAFSKDIIEDLQEEGNLVQEYQNLIANSQFDFEGTPYTVSSFYACKELTDDKRRYNAWLAEGQWFKDNLSELDSIYDSLVKVRDRMGKKLGFKDYTDLGYRRRMRNCYTKEDVKKFRQNIVKYIVPLAEKIYENQAKRLGKEYPMNFADNALTFKSGTPKPHGSDTEILDAAQLFYDGLSKETSDFYRLMRESHLLDVLPRKGKADGGYCTPLYSFKMPFVFANFSGTRDDVETVTHEVGHAFACYINRDRIPFECVWPPLDACEIHSISMEFLSWQKAELFFKEDTKKFYYAHLSSAITFLPYGAMVDEFQHRVYEKPEMSAKERHGVWRELSKTYMPWVKLDGEIPFYSDGCAWERQLHIYLYPFYFIDYCIAWCVGLQIWSIMQKDYKEAFNRYMTYTRGGGSMTLLELLKSANLGSPFDEETLREVASNAEKWLSEFDFSDVE